MRTRIFSLASAALCLFAVATTAQDGASRKLLQVDLAGLLGGGGTQPLLAEYLRLLAEYSTSFGRIKMIIALSGE